MNIKTRSSVNLVKTSITTAVVFAIMTACAVAPMKPDGAADARDNLTRLQSDSNLASRVPLAMKDAENAVRDAEQPQADRDLGAHRVYLAARKVDIARAQAETSLAEDQRAALSAERESARLNARTREVDAARSQAARARAEGIEQRIAADQARDAADIANTEAATARAQGIEQRVAADQARNEAELANTQAAKARAQGVEQRVAADQARNEADLANTQAAKARAQGAEQAFAADQARAEANAAKSQTAAAQAEGAEQRAAANRARGQADAASAAAAGSEQQAAELQRQIDVLHAKPTDRGLVLTLGDVLFMSGRAELRAGATGNLNKLVAFLNTYPDRTVIIQGYTDSIGSEGSNQGLSERRADSVRSYLARQGIGAMRLSSSGRGASDPVAGNDTAAGRQQNRRVEVTISNPPAVSR